MRVTSTFDGGNIEVIDITDDTHARLRIRPDNNADFLQWFYFRVSGARGRDTVLEIVNAGDAAYGGGYRGYRAVASHDRQYWFRVPTEFDGKHLTIRHRPEADARLLCLFRALFDGTSRRPWSPVSPHGRGLRWR